MIKIITATLFAFLVMDSAQAGVLPKNVVDTKAAFDKVGATACSYAIADALAFLTKDKGFDSNRQWDTKSPNTNPISLDFAIEGNKSGYSMVGAIVAVPAAGKCITTYTFSKVTPGTDCSSVMESQGFVEPEWKITFKDPNGDGGEVKFVELVKSPAVSFMFNDVAGGCNLIKRETYTRDAAK